MGASNYRKHFVMLGLTTDAKESNLDIISVKLQAPNWQQANSQKHESQHRFASRESKGYKGRKASNSLTHTTMGDGEMNVELRIPLNDFILRARCREFDGGLSWLVGVKTQNNPNVDIYRVRARGKGEGNIFGKVRGSKLMTLQAQQDTGRALAWSSGKAEAAYLATGCVNGEVCQFDLNKIPTTTRRTRTISDSSSGSGYGLGTSASTSIGLPVTTYKGHQGQVLDIAWKKTKAPQSLFIPYHRPS